MVANLASVVRVTTRSSAVWRECAGCAALAALAPDETHCPDCRPAATTAATRPRRRAA
jgi:hypothetical protein